MRASQIVVTIETLIKSRTMAKCYLKNGNVSDDAMVKQE